MASSRLIRQDDAKALAAVLRQNRAFLAPWEPVRDEGYFMVDGQQRVIDALLEQYDMGTCMPRVIVDEDDQVVGRVVLNGIVRGFFQSCSLAYWLSASHTGRGLATTAVEETVTLAFRDLSLHRVQAETLTQNERSQRLLQRLGFEQYGTARSYLKVAGRWQDHVLFQRLSPHEDC